MGQGLSRPVPRVPVQLGMRSIRYRIESTASIRRWLCSFNCWIRLVLQQRQFVAYLDLLEPVGYPHPMATYYANGTIKDYPASTQFVRWDQYYAGLALKVTRREMARLFGWEAAASKDYYSQLLASAASNDRCGLFCVHSTTEDVDWPRYACFCNWSLSLDSVSFEHLLNDINSGNCQWCSTVVQILDQQCCGVCQLGHVSRDPCLQGSVPVGGLSFVLGQPHNFKLCGQSGPLPETWDQMQSILDITAWLGADKSFAGNKSASGQPVPSPPPQFEYGTQQATTGLHWGWIAASGAIILGAVAWGMSNDRRRA
jgi:hypothetical protein